MIIPKPKTDRERLYSKLVKDCFASRNDRKARYDILRNWFLYGNAETQQPAAYNKLFSHVDLLGSFLFSGETTSFIIEVPKTDGINYDFEIEKAKVMTPRVNDAWHDSDTDLMFNDALNWALVFDTMILKFVPKGKGQFGSYAIEPHAFGVLREDISTISEQEAMAHEFFMTESELRRSIKNMSDEEQGRILSALQAPENAQDSKTLPAGVQTLIINSTIPETGEASGEVNVNSLLLNKFEPSIGENGVVCYELWVFDDELKDYRKIVMVNGESILHDSEKNTFVPGEVPFVKITPNGHYNYFWGRSELMYLIPLQEWMNERIPQIKSILAKLADPPIAAWGMTESRLNALRFAGGIYGSPDPAATGKIERDYPVGATELFREFHEVEGMYDDISGIRGVVKGASEPGVRAQGHADMLAKLGSTRIKKKAAILEDAAEKYATLILKCLRLYDSIYMKTEKGTSFVAKQLHESAEVKVDSHSSSPIALQEHRETSMMLFKEGIFDKEDIVDAMRIQNTGVIKSKIKRREEESKPIKVIHDLVEKSKPGEEEGIIKKLKKMLHIGTGN